jgi:transposase-like protein
LTLICQEPAGHDGHHLGRKRNVLVERLREFVRLNYVTAAEIARQIGVRDSTVYSWLLAQARPAEPKRITALAQYGMNTKDTKTDF